MRNEKKYAAIGYVVVKFVLPTLRRQASVLLRLPQCTTTTAACTSAGASPTAARARAGLSVAEVL